jgi:hypothetical protein
MIFQRYYTYTREALQQDFSANAAPNFAKCQASTSKPPPSSVQSSALPKSSSPQSAVTITLPSPTPPTTSVGTLQPSASIARSSSHVNLGAIIGGAVGGASILVIGIAIIFLCFRRRGQNSRPTTSITSRTRPAALEPYSDREPTPGSRRSKPSIREAPPPYVGPESIPSPDTSDELASSSADTRPVKRRQRME